MEIIEIIAEYGAWSWVVGGAILLAVELAVPGGVFLWFGMAAIATGLITLVTALGWQWQWVVFAFLSLVSLWIWYRYFRNRHQASDRPFLNRRAHRYIGEVFVLVEAIENGRGKMRIGDSNWIVTGPDLREGSRVRVTSADGSILTVEAADT